MTWNMADLFELVADAAPDRECLVSGDRRLTYRQLEERAAGPLGGHQPVELGLYRLLRAEPHPHAPGHSDPPDGRAAE